MVDPPVAGHRWPLHYHTFISHPHQVHWNSIEVREREEKILWGGGCKVLVLLTKDAPHASFAVRVGGDLRGRCLQPFEIGFEVHNQTLHLQQGRTVITGIAKARRGLLVVPTF